MGYIEFKNEFDEWESMPTPEEEENLRKNAAALKELGFRLICQLCNKTPNWIEIRKRWTMDEWQCNNCHKVNKGSK